MIKRLACSLAFIAIVSATPSFAQLNGVYTIGGVSPNYATWGAAVSDLNTLGVSGPVTFLIASGTYTEQLIIDNPSGTSATNTVTFLAATPTKPVLQYTSTAFATNYVIRMELADYFIFKNIHLKALGTTGYGHIIEMKVSDFNTFDGCIFDGVTTGDITLNESLVYTPDDGATPLRNGDNTFKNNTFNNGSHGLHLFGEPVAGPSGVTITNNTFNSQVIAAIDASYHTSLTITDNLIRDDAGTSATYDAIDLDRSDGTITGNDITVGFGRRALLLGLAETDGRRYLIANNFFNVQGLNTLIAVSLSDETDFYHNTVRLSSLDASDQALRVDAVGDVNVLNNLVIAVLSGYALYVETGATLTSNHNDFYSALGPDRFRWSGTDYGDLDGYRSASLQDSSSVARVLSFVDATNGDLHLAGSSTTDPFLGGTPLGSVPTDIDGDTRSLVRPFMGADDTGTNIDPLCGAYTIGGTTPDYTTYNDAVTDIIGKGITCSVTFNVRPVTFTEQITLEPIEGVSSADTVLFKRSNPASPPVLQYAATSGSDNWVVRFDSSAHITIDGHTLTATAATRGRILVFRDGSHDNRVSNSTLNSLTSGGTLTSQSIAYFNAGSPQNDNQLKGNTFNDGTVGVNLQDRSLSISITDNVFDDQRFHALLVAEQENLRVEGNTVIASAPDASYAAFDFSRGFDSDVTGNQIEIDVGIGLRVDSTGKNLQPVRYNNNFVVAPMPVDMVSNNTIELNHNSLLGTGSEPTLDMSNGMPLSATTIKNNLIVNQGGGPVYSLGSFLPVGIDYNDLFTTGAVLAVDGGTNYVDLASLQSGTGRDANSVSKAVTVVSNTSPFDLHLTGASDGDTDLGAPPLAGIDFDIDGDVRGDSLAYMGADEGTAFFALCGNYTINHAGGADYISFSQAVQDLNSAGISCPVTMVGYPGTYNEQIAFGFIHGTSASDTVLFTVTDPSDPPKLEFASTGSGNNYVVKFDSTRRVTLDHVWFTNTGTGPFARVIVLERQASFNRVRSSVITGLAGAATRGGSLVYGAATNASNNVFRFGSMTNGYRAIDLEGVSVGDRASDNHVGSLTMTNQFDRAVRLLYQNNALVERVTVNDGSDSATNFMGIQVDGDTATVIQNKIFLTKGGAGMRINGAGSASTRRYVANNFIAMDSPNAGRAFFASGPYVDFYHNTVAQGASSPVGASAVFLEAAADNVDVRNNLILGLHGGYAYRVAAGVTGLQSDYNDIYQTAGADPLASWAGSDAADLVAFRALSGTDGNAVSTAVTFVSSSDLHLDGGSVGDNALAGSPLASVGFDIDFNLRSTTAPYMGADEAGTPLVPPLRLDIRAYLEGPFSTDSMSAALNVAGYLPTAHPYAGAPWNYLGSEAVGATDASPPNGIPDFFDANPDITDWVLVQLRTGDPLATMTLVGTRAGFVLSDGSIVGTDGASPLTFQGVASGSYYVVAGHLNHLAIMTPTAVAASDDTLSYDFTTDLSKAYTDGGTAMKSLAGGNWGMFAGDGNADGQVTAPDFNLWNAATTAGATGYEVSDFNRDGQVTAPDFNLWNANTTAGATTQIP